MAPGDASAGRVIRGGCVERHLRGLRTASRFARDSGYRVSYLGLRCGEFQSPVRSVRGAGSSEEIRRLGVVRSNAQRANPRARPAGSTWESETTGRCVFPDLTTVRLISDLEEVTIRTMTRPNWASAIGRDGFGLWAEFTIKDTVRQRPCWIPPGQFVMGSPPDEAGRFDDEGPQRSVRIPRGFWLFDTPCTQELWEAVVGENPSYFRSPTRPVEKVSWKDCQAFVKRLNGQLRGIGAVAPLRSAVGVRLPCRHDRRDLCGRPGNPQARIMPFSWMGLRGMGELRRGLRAGRGI